MKIKNIFVTILFVFLLIGCKEEIVARSINQKQANEIVATLAKSKIISKTISDPSSKKMFAVSVAGEDYVKSVTILSSKGLPKENEITFSDLIQQRGILPDSKDMESLRLDKAMAIEIQEALLSLPSIIKASVIVRSEIKDKDGTSQGPFVSVIIVKNAEYFADDDKEEIVKLIHSSLPGIDKNNITIVEKEESDTSTLQKLGIIKQDKEKIQDEEKFLWYWHIGNGERKSLAFFIILLSLGIGVICLWCGIIVGYYKVLKKGKIKIMEAPNTNLLKKENEKGKIK